MMLTSFARLRRHGALLVIVSLSMLHARFAIAGCLVPDLASQASEICLAQCVQAASDFMGGADPGNPLPVAAFPTTRLFPLAWSGTASCAAQPKPTFATGPPLIYLLQRLLT
jgi:hypothetical protein